MARSTGGLYCGLYSSICGKKGRGKSRCVEKSKGGTFPLRLEIPQKRRISTFPTAPAINFLISPPRRIAELQTSRLVCCFAKAETERPGDQLFSYRLKPS